MDNSKNSMTWLWEKSPSSWLDISGVVSKLSSSKSTGSNSELAADEMSTNEPSDLVECAFLNWAAFWKPEAIQAPASLLQNTIAQRLKWQSHALPLFTIFSVLQPQHTLFLMPIKQNRIPLANPFSCTRAHVRVDGHSWSAKRSIPGFHSILEARCPTHTSAVSIMVSVLSSSLRNI